MHALEMVLMVYWLTSGQVAYDYAPRQLCESVKAMTEQSGDLVELVFQDGSTLRATRVECRAMSDTAKPGD